MKCVLNGPNARVFAKAVQSLSKFGSDLFIEAEPSGFQLRSVNANRSAVGTFRFCCSFFDAYNVGEGTSNEENYCRLSMKACLGVFKNMKQVETCHINIDTARCKFLVQMNCKYETVKHFILSIIDDENISADVQMDDAPNSIRGSYKIFSEIVSNFQMAEEEITLEAGKETLNVKNYVEGSRVNDKFMRSQLKLSPEEFDGYNVTEETSVTFCLREFKAFLLFSESLFEYVNILFREAGSPIIFQIKKSPLFEATLVMSTLSPEDVTMCEDLQERSITESFLSRTVQKPAQKRKPPKEAPSNQSKRLNSTKPASDTTQRGSEASPEDTPIFRFDVPSIDPARNHASAGTSDELPNIPNAFTASQSMNTNPQAGSESEVFVTFVETEETPAEDEQIPQSPGRDSVDRRGLRSIFSRCFEATYVPREPSPSSQVYVPDSDDDS